jgi:hypothetical protein
MGNQVISNQAFIDLLPGRMKGLFAPAVSPVPVTNGDAIMQYREANRLGFNAKWTDGNVREFRMAMIDRPKSITTLGDTGLPSGTSGNVVVVGDGSVLVANALTDSVFAGTQSGAAITAGNGNSAVGNLTFALIGQCYHNTTMGDASSRYMQDGSTGNSHYGYVSATEWRWGSWNNCNGSYSGAYSERGDFCVFHGGYSGAHSFGSGTYNGSHDQGSGYEAMLVAEGHHNLGGGYQVLYGCKGDHNQAWGDQAGSSLSQVVRGSNLDITTVTSQTNITVTGGPGTSYTGMRVVVYDASNGGKPYWGRGDYNHTTGVITLEYALPITITTSDTVDIATIPRGNLFWGRLAGRETTFQKPDAVNTIAIGDNTFTTMDNQIILGNNDVIETRIRGTNVYVNRMNVAAVLLSATSVMAGHTYLSTNLSDTTGTIYPDASIECKTKTTTITGSVASPTALSRAESRRLLRNIGATAEVAALLPDALVTSGDDFEFACVDADGIRVKCGVADTIRDGASVSATGGYMRSTVIGSTLRVKAVDDFKWFVVSKTGTWTIDS